MEIFKNLFKDYEAKRATNKINANALKLSKKLKSILVSIGWINYPIELNGVKFIVKEIRDITGTHYYIAILDYNDKEFYFDADKPATFWANKEFLKRANGIFKEAKTIQEKHIKNCSNILEQVKDL